MAFSGLAKAQSLEQLRSQILTMFYGRRDGNDPNDFGLGIKDVRQAIENITTTAQTTLANHGFSGLCSTPASSAAYTLQAPTPGVYKQITQLCTSTLGFVVSAGSAVNFVTTLGSSFISAVFAGLGHTLNLYAISTSAWAATASFSTAAGMTMTTATS